MDMTILKRMHLELQGHVNKKTRDMAQHFFKEETKHYGVKTAIVSKIAKKYYSEIKHLDKSTIFSLCEELQKTDYNEDAYIAFHWSYSLQKKYDSSDFKTFERWLNKYINNWAKCDTFCNHTVAAFVEQYPEYIDKLKVWSKSKNRWLKRASAVTLIIPARKGKFLKDIIEIADILLLDPDDMVQKGYGWMLKETSKKHQKEVFDYVVKHKNEMPRTALRYAIEKMPASLRKKAMMK